MILVSLVVTLDINHLKSISYPHRETLRFPVDLLTIEIMNNWLNLTQLLGRPIIPSSNGRSQMTITTTLNDILFDTGNETGYCYLSTAFLEDFKKKTSLSLDHFAIQEMLSANGHIYRTFVTKNIFAFCFGNNITFNSKIGFFENIPIKWLRTINIGINSICQFLSILIPEPPSQLYAYFEKI